MSSHGLINTVCTVLPLGPAEFSSSGDSGIRLVEERSELRQRKTSLDSGIHHERTA